MFTRHAINRLEERTGFVPTNDTLDEIEWILSNGDYKYVCPSYDDRHVIAFEFYNHEVYAVCSHDMNKIITFLTKPMVLNAIRERIRQSAG